MAASQNPAPDLDQKGQVEDHEEDPDPVPELALVAHPHEVKSMRMILRPLNPW
jgi:hypothetical protein